MVTRHLHLAISTVTNLRQTLCSIQESLWQEPYLLTKTNLPVSKLAALATEKTKMKLITLLCHSTASKDAGNKIQRIASAYFAVVVIFNQASFDDGNFFLCFFVNNI